MHNLTKPQRLIYETDKFAGGSIATICGSILFEGAEDVQKIKQCINEIYRKNDALRIKITENFDGTKQSVSDCKEKDIEVLYFDNEDAFSTHAQNLSEESMDMYGELCDIRIIVLPNKYGILTKLHHIIGDAWTLTLIATQFSKLLNGEEVIAYSYCDYIDAEQKYLESKRFDKDRTYWTNQFKKCDEPVLLSEKEVKTYKSTRKTFTIDKEQTKLISDFAVANNSSMYGVLMTAVSVYLNRIRNNAEKFYIGTAVLNRMGLQDKNTMGMFINTAPVLIELNNEESFAENMVRVNQNSTEVFRHQKYNYSDILKDIRNEYKFTGKLYDIMFSYQNAQVDFSGKPFETEWYHPGMQSETLEIHVDDRDNEGILKIHYDYEIEKLSEHHIEKMHKHIFNLLFDAIKNTDKPIKNLEILSDTEMQQLLFDFNDTKIAYPKDKCVHTLFEEQVLKIPEKVAVIATDRTLTYKELNEESNKIAHSLIKKGVKPNDIVAFMLPRKSYLLSVMFGILKSGAAYMPIDPDYPQDRINYMLSDSNANLCITEDSLIELLNNAHTDNPKISMDSSDLYCVLHTSGSTGKPKLSALKHSNIDNFICGNKYFFDNINICVSATIITFDAFILDTIVPLCIGVPTKILKQEEIFNQELFECGFNDIKNAFFFSTPTKLKHYIENSKTGEFIKHISTFVLGGEVFTQELFDLIRQYNNNANIYNIYGPTEDTICVLVDKIKDSDISIGNPIANTQVYILDKFNNPVPIGITGELCIAGDCVGAGYLNRPELTAEKFVDNPFGDGKMYKTGDLAYWREDGNIIYVGRNDFQVKIRGLRIELGEIENAICLHNNISQAVVVVRKDDNGRQLICAFYTEKEHTDIAEIKKNISDKLPKYMMPHIFTVLEEMPLTSSGKINRKALPDVDLNNIDNSVEYVKPQTELEKELVCIMESVLNYSPIGLNDDFFDLGGDSLKAIEFVSKAHNKEIFFDLKAIFDNPTPKELCEYLNSSTKDENTYKAEDFNIYDKILSKNTLDRLVPPQKVPIGNVFITGATGFLGIHILDNYLQNESGIAYCLVRGENQDESEQRLNSLLHHYFGNKYDECNRIKVICGDITNRISVDADIDMVINSAATVKHYGLYDYFYNINVNGTRNAIELAKSKNAKLIHISTTAVGGNNFGDDFDAKNTADIISFSEKNLYIEQKLENVYARSKFEAERLVLDAINDGLKANICRMGNLMNRFSDLVFQPNYTSNAFTLRIKSILELGILPTYLKDLPIEFSPIDYAAQAVMTIARYFNTEYTVFHIINNHQPIYFNSLIAVLRELNINFDVVSDDVFANALKDVAEQSDKTYIFEAFINDMDEQNRLVYDSNIRIENDFTVKYLNSLGFDWCEIDKEYIKKWIEYFRKIGYLEV